MKVQALIDALSLQPFHLARPQEEITGGYCGELLSWVMGRAPAGAAWMTIMSNANVAAVASLTDVACIILAEGVQPEPDLLAKAQAHDINLLGSGAGSYEIAIQLAALLGTAL